MRLLRCYVLFNLYYVEEIWTLTESLKKRLEAFEMWLCRTLTGVSWTNRASNTEILQRVKKEQGSFDDRKSKKAPVPRSRHEKHRKVSRKRGVGRGRISWLGNLRNCQQPVSYTHLDVYKRQPLA